MSIYDEINKIKKEGNPYDRGFLAEYPELYGGRTSSEWAREVSMSWPQDSHWIPKDFGKNKYDRNLSWADIYNMQGSLDDYRSKMQSGWAKLGSSVANFGVLTLTTAADGILGTLTGLGNLGVAAASGKRGKELWNAFVQNPFSEWMVSIQRAAEEAMPMYLSDEYRQNQATGEWWKNITNNPGNFLAENLKNVGFTAGMVMSSVAVGGIVGAIGKAAKATNIVNKAATKLSTTQGSRFFNMPVDKVEKMIKAGKVTSQEMSALGIEGIADAAKHLRTMSATTMTANTLLSPMSESRFEAIHAYQERVDEGMAYLENPETLQKIQDKVLEELGQPNLLPKYDMEGNIIGYEADPNWEIRARDLYNKKIQEAVKSIEDNARVIANATALANYPILMGSNLILFGRVMGGSFTTQRGIAARFDLPM